ncbi:nucleotidyltransferase domain-containing protein [Desulfonauticus submarinus]
MPLSVRLSKKEIETIKKVAEEIFGQGTEVYLFGSRIDPTKRGGDIDLYIVPAKREEIFKRKLRFLVELKLKIGEQKIDVVIAKDPARDIEKEALTTGVKL